MGCGSSTAVGIAEQKQNKNKKGKNKLSIPEPKAISFVVRLDDDDNRTKKKNSFKIKLPKRLQRLQEKREKSLTTEEIDERQKLAKKRRKSGFEQRVFKSRKFQDKILAANQNRSGSTKSPNESLDCNEGDQESKTMSEIKKENNEDKE